MVYFGDGRWIQADPMTFRVTVGKADRTRNPWFGQSVTMHTWTHFD